MVSFSPSLGIDFVFAKQHVGLFKNNRLYQNVCSCSALPRLQFLRHCLTCGSVAPLHYVLGVYIISKFNLFCLLQMEVLGVCESCIVLSFPLHILEESLPCEKSHSLDFPACLISFQHSHVSLAEVIGLLGGRYSEADKIVEVSVCLFTFPL